MPVENSLPIRVGRPRPRGGPPASGARQKGRPGPGVPLPADRHLRGADGLVLEADLPGADDESVSQLEENILSLRAHVQTTIPEGARVLYEESAADFVRSFILGDDVDRSRIRPS